MELEVENIYDNDTKYAQRNFKLKNELNYGVLMRCATVRFFGEKRSRSAPKKTQNDRMIMNILKN